MSIDNAKMLLKTATEEVRTQDANGNWRDTYEIGTEMLANLAAANKIGALAEDLLRGYIGAAEALKVAPCEKTGLYTQFCDGELCQRCPALADFEKLFGEGG